MRHNHHPPTERIDRIRQTINRRDVQPIRRLIQQQHVRPLNRQQRKHDPALLPFTQRAHQCRLRLAAEAVLSQLLPPVLVVLALVAVLVAHEVERRFREVELLGRVLAVEPELEVRVPVHDAAGGGELAGHEAQEGGFADAVGADERGARVHVDAEVEVLVEVVFRGATVAEGDVVEGEDGRGQFLDVGEAEGEDAVLVDGLDEAVGLHLVEDLLAGLGLPDEVGVGAGRGDEFLDVGDFFLLFGVGFHLVGFLLAAGLDVGVVVPPVVDELAHAHVDHVGADAVEEVHAVADEDEGAVPFLEVLFQPDAGLEIQMRRWVVEKEEGRLDEEGFGQGDAHAPPTGHVFSSLVDGDLVETETGENEGCAGLEGRRVHGVHSLKRLAVESQSERTAYLV